MTKMTRANDLNTATKQQLYEYDLDLNSISLSHTTNKQKKANKLQHPHKQPTHSYIQREQNKKHTQLNSNIRNSLH